MKGRNIAAIQETIEEIGFRGDQEEEEDVFAIAEDNRRKRREAAEDADAVEEDEVLIKSAHNTFYDSQVPTRVFLRRQADMLLNAKQKKGGRH